MAEQPDVLLQNELTIEDVHQSPQWVVWRLEEHQRLTKVLYDPATGRRASSTNAATWCCFEQARWAWQRSRGYYQGVGIVFYPQLLPVMGVDIDHCANLGELAPWATALLALLDSYTEASPSGTGRHVLLQGAMPAVIRNGIMTHPGRKRCFRAHESTDGRHALAAVELYSEGRFFTVTHCRDTTYPALILPRQAQLLQLYRELFGPPAAIVPSLPQKEIGGSLLDRELWEKALAAKNGQVFRSLWYGQGSSDASQGDYHLCFLLAFWTGRNALRMDRLFRQSGRMRPKWDEPRGSQTYGDRTIARACAACTTIYQPPTRGSHSLQQEDHHV